MSGSFGWLHEALGGSSGINVPGPPQFSIQFNNPLGTFAGSPDFLFDPSTDTVSLGLATSHTGKLNFNGTTSGIVTLTTQDAAGTWIAKLPTSSGVNGFVLTTDGGTPANLTWSAGPAAVFPNPQWNPIVNGSHSTLSASNSTITNDGTANTSNSISVAGHDGGKWYAEFKLLHVTANGEGFGLGDINTALNTFPGQDVHSWVIFDNFGFTFHNNSAGVAVTTPVLNDVVQIAWDADTGKMFFGINNTWQNTGDPVLETNPCFTGVFGYLYLVGSVSFNGGQIAFQSNAFSPPQGYSSWGLASQGTKAQGSQGAVQYDNSGGFGGAANFFISSGNPNVTAGNQYLYDSAQAYAAQTSLNNFYLGVTGNFTATGTSNSAFGDQCLQSLTTGARNAAEGVKCLQSVTTGGANVGIGFQALQVNTTGTGNVALGDSALQNNNGSNNFAMGSGALQIATGAQSSVALGPGSLASASSCTNNVAVGAQSLQNLQTASNVVAVGSSAGNGITTGSRNTIIGDGAGPINPVTAINCIIVGYQVDLPADSTGSINIGNGIYGLNCNATGSAPGGSELIGIKNNAPAVELDVGGRIKTQVYTVGTLPAGVDGARVFVTNALGPAFGAPVVGGGAVHVPVYYDSASVAWIVG